MLKKQLAQGNNGLTKTKYLTFGIEAESMRQAKPVSYTHLDVYKRQKRTHDCTAHFIRTDLLTPGVLSNLRKVTS